MARNYTLPLGQHEVKDLPRFGLAKFANRFPQESKKIAIDIGGNVRLPVRLSTHLDKLERVDEVSDFHCVTTWTTRDVSWSGYRFSDFYKELVVPLAQPEPTTEIVVFKGQDGYRVGMRLEDLLASDVLLADKLNGLPLPIAHGAPLRLVAPAHYGYKSAKHIAKIEFWCAGHTYQSAGLKFMDHPRARVVYEERGTLFPGWILRRLYRPLVASTRRRFASALATHMAVKKGTASEDNHPLGSRRRPSRD